MNFLTGALAAPGEVKLADGSSISVGGEPAKSPGPVVVGVRPDGFSVTEPDAAALRGRIVLNEYLGRESYLHLDLAHGGSAVVEVSPDLHLPVGRDVGLVVKPGAAHLFVAANQQRLAA